MRHSPVFALVLSALALGSLRAHAQPPVQPGARIRVTVTGVPGRQTGTLARIDADTLTVGAIRVARQSVSRLEVSTGRRSHTLLGAGIGFLIGASAGGIAMAAETPGGLFCEEVTKGECILLGAGALGVVALPVGAIIGALVRTDRWEAVELNRLGVHIFPQRDGALSLTVSLRF